MMTRSELLNLASSLGVGAAALEKVVRLTDILSRLDSEVGAADRYALKGGTALNLFLLPMPRLSVDIDINFLRNCTAAELQVLRPEFMARVNRCIQLAGCRVVYVPDEYAGGKFLLRFTSLLGGDQNLELDVNFVARIPLLGVIRRRVTIEQLPQVEVTTYTIEELAAGKFAALVSRTAPRDHYDAFRLLSERPHLLADPGFRATFIVMITGAREDIRLRSGHLNPLETHDVRHQLVPLLRQSFGDGKNNAVALAAELDAAIAPAVASLLDFRPEEREFLKAFLDRGELIPDLLTDDAGMQTRIAAQPMLRWKLKHTRAHLGLPSSMENA